MTSFKGLLLRNLLLQKFWEGFFHFFPFFPFFPFRFVSFYPLFIFGCTHIISLEVIPDDILMYHGVPGGLVGYPRAY